MRIVDKLGDPFSAVVQKRGAGWLELRFDRTTQPGAFYVEVRSTSGTRVPYEAELLAPVYGP
jgi:hypothetical protein